MAGIFTKRIWQPCICQPNDLKIKKKTERPSKNLGSEGAMAHPGPPLESPLAMLSTRVVCFMQSAVTSVAATRLNKRLLFVIYVVAANFISFKPERKRSCNLPL